MKINTRDFGEFEVSNESIIKFVQPLYGFEEFTDYVIIQDDNAPDSIAWLQSAENSELCFILASSNMISGTENYRKRIPAEELSKINSENDEFEIWFVMVVKDSLAESTVNLKSPVVINPANQSAMQIILEDDLPVRFHAFNEGKGE